MKRVKKVATPKPYMMASAIAFQKLALADPKTTGESRLKSMSIPTAIGARPIIVVIAVSKTGLNLTAEARIMASFLPNPHLRNLTTKSSITMALLTTIPAKATVPTPVMIIPNGRS